MEGINSISFGHEHAGQTAGAQGSSDKEKKEPYGLLNILDTWDLLE